MVMISEEDLQAVNASVLAYVDGLGLKPEKDESAQEFTERVVRYLHAVPDAWWETIPELVQSWVVGNSTALITDEPLVGVLRVPEKEDESPKGVIEFANEVDLYTA